MLLVVCDSLPETLNSLAVFLGSVCTLVCEMQTEWLCRQDKYNDNALTFTRCCYMAVTSSPLSITVDAAEVRALMVRGHKLELTAE